MLYKLSCKKWLENYLWSFNRLNQGKGNIGVQSLTRIYYEKLKMLLYKLSSCKHEQAKGWGQGNAAFYKDLFLIGFSIRKIYAVIEMVKMVVGLWLAKGYTPIVQITPPTVFKIGSWWFANQLIIHISEVFL